MTTYKISPMERKASFASLKAKEKQGVSFSDNRKAMPLSQPQKEQKEDYSPLLRSGATVLDVSVNMLQGATDAFEGIVDFVAGGVGLIGGLFSDEFENDVKNFIAYDFTSDAFGRDGDEGLFDTTWGSDISKASYLEEDGIINGIAQGIGGMLPAVAISAATGGAAAGAVLSKLPTATFITSAAGRSTEDALKEGASFGQALGYGTVAGVIEGGLESLGGITMGGANQLADSVIGRALIKKGADSFVRRGIGKLAYNFASEGVEEILADLIDPINKQAFGIDKDAMSNYGEVLKGLPKTFVIGGATGVVMGGLQSGISAVKNKSKGGKRFLSVAAEMQNIEDVMKASEAIKMSETSTDEQKDAVESAANKQIVSSLESISANLKGMSEAQRVECFKAAPILHDFMNGKGELNADVMDSLSAQIESGKATTAFVSRSLAGKDKTVQADLDDMAEEAAEMYAEENGVSIEEARAAVGTFAINDAELSEKGQEAFRRFVKARNALDAIAGAKTGFVVTKANDTFHAAAKDGKLYIGADSFENGTWEKDLIHEYTHFAEGSAEYAKLAKFLIDEDLTVDTKNGKQALYKVAAESVLSKGYGFTAEEIGAIIDKKQTGKDLTAEEADKYSVFNEELMAHATEHLLGNEAFIGKLVAKDAPLARKAFDKIVDICKAIGGNAASKTLRTAQKLYIKAAEQSGNTRLAKYILSHAPELEEEESLDSEEKVQYNRKGATVKKKKQTYSQYYSTAMQWAFSSKTKPGDIKVLYNPQDNTWNKLVADESEDRYGTMLSIEDVPENAKAIKDLHSGVYNENHREEQRASESVRENYERYWSHSSSIGDDNFDVEEQDADGRSREVYGKESESDRSGDSNESARNRRTVKFSRKSSTEALDHAYMEAVESGDMETAQKMVDEAAKEAGYDSPKVYHGSSETFTEFSYGKIGSATGVSILGEGFYFTDKKQLGEGYGDKLYEVYLKLRNPYVASADDAYTLNVSVLENQGYDGVILETPKGKIYMVFENTQIKSADPVTYDDAGNVIPLSKRFDVKKSDIRFSKKTGNGVDETDDQRDSVSYSYDELVKKHDMLITELSDNVPLNPDGKIDRAVVLKNARADARAQNNENNNQKETYVFVPDINLHVRVARDGIDHGLTRNSEDTALATMKVGTLLSRSIAFNELDGRTTKKKAVDMSYVLLSVAQNKKSSYLVRIVVDKNTNAVSEISTYGLSAVRAKKEGALFMPKGNERVEENTSDSYLRSTISIADLLENVKSLPLANEIFSKDVLEKLGVTRRKGTLSESVRFARKAPRPSGVTYEISDGQVKKLIANYTRGKTYSKKEADEAIHEILANTLYSEDEHATLRGKSREEVVDMLWQGLNGVDPGKRASVALEVADYVIEHAMLERVLDVGVQMDIELMNILRPYLRKLDLDSLRDEISHRYDDKTRGVYSRWSKPKDKQGLPVDVVAKELAEQGFTIEEQNPADVFFAIASAYEDAADNVAATKRMLKDAVGAEEIRALRQEIVRRVLRTYDEKGSTSMLSEFISEQREKLRKINQTWKERFQEEHNRTYYGNRVLHKLRKLKDLKTGAFLNASQYKTDTFKGSIEKLARIEHRGNLNKSSAREILAGLAEWYKLGDGNLVITKENYDEGIAATLEILMKGEGEFTADELLALESVVDYFTHFVQNWGKVYRDGKYVEAKPLAKDYRDGIIRNNRAKVGWMRKWFEKYYRSFGDPEALMRYMDAYDPTGFYTTMFLKLREGLTKAQLMEMEMREDLEAFYEKHKDFLTEIQEKTVKYRGQQIPLAQAMLLYMTFNRDQALRGLAYSGFKYYNGDDVITVEGFAEFASDLSIEELRFRARLEQQAVGEQFTATEKEYISIIEKLFNEDCKQAKRDTDMLLRGYSNALESYYVPIRRGNIAKSVDDASTFYEELDRVSNAGFNKDTVKNAKNELFMEGLDRVIDRHVRAVSMYANLALVLNEYDVLYNLDLNENPNKPVTIGTAGVNTSISKNARQKNANGTDPKDIADEYFKKLIADIQGVSKRDAWDRALGKLRGSFAKFQLGANPKVWLTQLSSFLASTSILDYASVVKGLGISGADVDKYCALAKLRNHENTAALAQGVIEKTDKLGDVLMTPIGKMDRLVVRKLFAACQAQVEKDGGAKIGTEENKVKAGELLTQVIYETQQNSLATERSAAMRHHNEIVKTMTMFSADAMKIVGRTVDAIGELATLKKKRAQATDPAEIKALDAAIKKAAQKTRKSVGALLMTSIFMALIAQGFRFLYDKDDEDTVWTFLADVFGNLFGGLPLIRDFVSRVTNGYDLEHYAYATVNDLFSAALSLGELSGDIIQGKATGKDVGKAAKDILYAGGALFGIPTRNAYNFVSGISRRLGADFDGSLYETESYREQLEGAIESGDEDKIAKIVGLMLDEKVGIEDDEVRREMAALVGQGFDNVIPSSVPSTITIDKVKYELDEEQKATYEKVYNTSLEKIATLVRTSAYKSATPEAKAKAMTTLYSIYRELAREAALDLDLETKGALFGTAFADKTESFALAVATASLFEADKDKKGESISGTRKAKVQKYVSSLRLTAVEKYMIMGYLGYTNTNGKAQVRAYINRLDLTPSQKRKLLELCGYK